MSVLKIKDQNNDWIQIPTIKGDKGDPFTYADFTTEQLESLKGKDGISPTVSVASDTSDDYRLSFTDETHTVTTPNLIPEAEKIFDVYPTDTASGSIASFPDGADDIPLKSCIVRVEPVQDLHGYDSPWPAGGGKNLFDQENVTVTGSGVVVLAKAIPAGTYTISALVTSTDTDVTYNRIAMWDESNTQLASTALLRDTRASASFTITSACAKVVFYAASSADNSSGDTATFTKVQIESGNTATAWTPYENICPITGWTGCEVQRTGINIFDGEVESGDYDVTEYKGGAKRSNAGRMRCANFIPVKPNTTYYSKMPYLNSIVVFYDEEKWMHSNGFIVARNTIFTTPSWCKYITFYYADTQYNNDISINYPATDTEYHDYKPSQTYPITFPTEAGTVYGAYVDVTGGELVVTHCKYIFTGDENIYKSQSYVGNPFVFDSPTKNMVAPFGKAEASETYCNILKTEKSKYHNIGDNSLVTNAVSGYSQVLFRGDIFGDTAESAKAKLKELYENGTPMVVVGKIRDTVADNFRYPLTPIEIRSLLGQNNIWSDTGDVSVEYRADTTLYIKRLTESDTDMVADSNIVSGQYFMVGNDLYKATVNIASGASVIVGTNAVKVSLAQALNEINA